MCRGPNNQGRKAAKRALSPHGGEMNSKEANICDNLTVNVPLGRVIKSDEEGLGPLHWVAGEGLTWRTT